MRVTVFEAKPSAELAAARTARRARFVSGRAAEVFRAAPAFGAAVLLTDFRLPRTAGRRLADFAFAGLVFDAARCAGKRLARPLRGRALRLPPGFLADLPFVAFSLILIPVATAEGHSNAAEQGAEARGR
jgi:hypothetical protein